MGTLKISTLQEPSGFELRGLPSSLTGKWSRRALLPLDGARLICIVRRPSQSRSGYRAARF